MMFGPTPERRWSGRARGAIGRWPMYAGGAFTLADGRSANRVARWDGTAWNEVGGGVVTAVLAFCVFDDGTGSALYVGGSFTTAGGQPANRIARWDGANWSALGSGLDSSVYALGVFDDGFGPALFAGGTLNQAGGQAVGRIARWDGTAWSALGAGVNNRVEALTVFDDGTGPALYAAGSFFQAGGGLAAPFVARWDGTAWGALGGAITNTVYALCPFDDGSGTALFVGGAFGATDAGESYLAKWAGCSAPGFQSEHGCFGNPALLAATSPGLFVGQSASFELTASGAGVGWGLLFAGTSGVDAQGCGLFVPGLGELLLTTSVGPFQLAGGPSVAGATHLAFALPDLPQLVGLQIGFQGAHAALSVPGIPVELSDGLVGTVMP